MFTTDIPKKTLMLLRKDTILIFGGAVLMQFEWINFYSEFATKLLSYKNDRKLLIKKINDVYAAIDLKMPKLESGDEIIDIDPFTVFGLFNKGITNANRIAIIKSIAKEFAIEAKTPDVFDGIPVLNNLKATFYGFKEDRKENDIDNIWNVFEAAIVLADEDNETNRKSSRNGMTWFMIRYVFVGT